MAIITTFTPVISANSNETVWTSDTPIAGTTIGPAKAGHVTMPPAETPAPTEQLQFPLTEQAQSPRDADGTKRKKRSSSAPSVPIRRTKAALILKALRKSKGATIAQLAVLSGWQPHSVRGFLSGTVRKKFGMNLVSDTGRDGQRRYRIVNPADKAD